VAVIEERWRPVIDFEGRYEVSNVGLVRNVAGLVLRPRTIGRDRGPSGYLAVTLYRGPPRRPNMRYVHRLVAEAFIGPRPIGYELNHKDGNKTNNDWRNLEWVTRSDNQNHAIAIGLKTDHGEGSPNAKLSTDEVRAIRALSTCGFTQRKLAAAFGVAQSQIGQIVRREHWRRV
jgi:hypothetical protein